MNLDMWKFIARNVADDQDCWVSTHEPEWQHDDGVWSCWSMCELAEALGIPEEFWPAPGECRRITRFEIVLETEAMNK